MFKNPAQPPVIFKRPMPSQHSLEDRGCSALVLKGTQEAHCEVKKKNTQGSPRAPVCLHG